MRARKNPKTNISARNRAAGGHAANTSAPLKRKKLPDGRWISFRPSALRCYWPIVARMPSLSHWPDKPLPFTKERSEVLHFIRLQCQVSLDVAAQVFTSCSQNKIITFSKITRLWRGNNAVR
jgi:hypothetical protein